MKQKLKEKINVGDKVKKPSFQKCVKMSKEFENLKNGDSVISNHTQQQQKLNNNLNVDREATTKAIVGGRLQFYKDGKFILELARAREGEKTGWISVPRKTYWPPTISTNSSTTFSKHESSTSLSYSDDNSSIQSSPWQRDHCWKQSRPRHNISKELAFFYTRPTRLHLSQECQKIAKSMRRQPLHKNGKINFKERIKKEEEAVENGSAEIKVKEEPKTLNESSSDEKGSSNDSKESIDTLDGVSKETRVDKLSKIVKKLSDRMASKLALNGNGSNGHHHHASTAVIPTSYSLASHIANSINSQSPHQHVSPRKRILRELEKVSLEDTKRSRPKSVTTNGTSNITHHPPQSSNNITANGSLTKNNENKAPQPPASSSRPISSYSITSLLAHNTSSSSTSSSNSSSNTPHNDSLTTSLHHQPQSYGRLQNSPPKSPGQKRKSPHMQSPIQSPSPEHHAFHKYRPMTTTPTSQAQMPPTSSPYNSSYHSPSYMRGSPSPSDALNSRLRTTNYQHSPSHHYGGTSSPSNYNARDSSLSPNVVEKNNNSRSTPTTTQSPAVRTVPKKTAALRQQFSSPTMNEKKTSPPVKNEVKPMDVDSLLRPSALIPPPMPPAAALGQMPHPAAAAALSHYPYMYSPLSYLPPPAVPPYYHPFYNPAMMAAAAAAAYRFPMPGYPGSATTLSPLAPHQQQQQHQSPLPPVSYAETKPTTNGQQQRNSSSPPAHHHPAYSSPWNPIPITNHSINDGNHIPKVKDEPLSSDVPLNLSKH